MKKLTYYVAIILSICVSHVNGASLLFDDPAELLLSDPLFRLNNDILHRQISDHGIIMTILPDGTHVYSWNLWHFGQRNGFGRHAAQSGQAESPRDFQNRTQEIADIITHILRRDPTAIICLQEVTGLEHANGYDQMRAIAGTFQHTLGKSLTYKQSGELAVVFNKDIVRLNGVVDDRFPNAAKFNFVTTRGFEFVLVNVHLKSFRYQDPARQQGVDNIVDFAKSTNPNVALIIGDWNLPVIEHQIQSHQLDGYAVSYGTQGMSLTWNDSTSTAQHKKDTNNVDGYMLLRKVN